FLALEVGLGNVFFADKLRVGGRDVHGDVVYQLFEIVGAGHEIALAIDFDQHADFASGMNVVRNRAFAGDAGSLLLGHGSAAFAENDDCLLQIAIRFGERFLAVHHGSAGLVAELLYLPSRNVG